MHGFQCRPELATWFTFICTDENITMPKVYLTSLGPSKFGHSSFILHPISKAPALDFSRFSASSDVHYAA